jgi:hypothetical protein
MRFARELVSTIDQMRSRRRKYFPEIEDQTFWSFYELCKDYSLVHIPGFYNVYQSLGHIAKHGIVGNAVECGCFYGGVAMFMGLTRRHFKLDAMDIILFDTFDGPPVGSSDRYLGKVIDTVARLPNFRTTTPQNIERIVGNLDGYRFIEGLVEDTLPVTETGDLALLRLDTDFYSSTKAELEILYPRLVRGGALIIDDYGLFQGARRATDEYFAEHAQSPLLNRIDQGVWAGVKP